MNDPARVAYVQLDSQQKLWPFHPKVSNRNHFVHELINCYGMLDCVKLLLARPATEAELRSFHSEEYINFLKKVNDLCDEDVENMWNDLEEFGLGYDNPFVPHLYDLAAITGGATIVAAEALMNGICEIAVNWNGGWHHAQRDKAAGFCYVNDVVLGILQLLTKFQKVLYIDLDLHHGDGTGSVDEVGQGKGKFYSVNIPLHDGVEDDQYTKLLLPLLNKVRESFQPDVVVCQCGADVLAGDPLNCFNLTLKSIGECVKTIMSWNILLMLLGGGGYNFPNTARLWTYLLSLGLSTNLVSDIPDHDCLMSYGPDYELHIVSKTMRNLNTDDYIESVYQTVMEASDYLHTDAVLKSEASQT